MANVIGGDKGAFGRDENQVLVLSRSGQHINLGPMPKTELAAELMELFAPKVEKHGS